MRVLCVMLAAVRAASVAIISRTTRPRPHWESVCSCLHLPLPSELLKRPSDGRVSIRAFPEETLPAANSASRPMRRSFDDSNIPSTIFSRWNRLSPFSGALGRGRLLACRGVCGPLLAISPFRQPADGSACSGRVFAPKRPSALSFSESCGRTSGRKRFERACPAAHGTAAETVVFSGLTAFSSLMASATQTTRTPSR